MGVGFGATVGFMDANGVWVPVRAGSTPLPTSGGGGSASFSAIDVDVTPIPELPGIDTNVQAYLQGIVGFSMQFQATLEVYDGIIADLLSRVEALEAP